MSVDALPPLPDSCWPVDTSCCTSWDAVDGEDVPVYSDAVKDRAKALAGQTMRLLTGYRVGGCPIVLRPCNERDRATTWATYPVAPGAGAGVPWAPVSIGGQWLNIGCGCASGCGCTTAKAIRLPGDAATIVQVKIDGVILPDAAYRLYGDGWLIRADGEGWPLTQDLTLDTDEVGTWSVEYVTGAAVDGLGAWVAGILACEYLDACTTGKCRLPAGVVQVARQGVTLNLAGGMFPGRRTGIQEVDAYLERWNPHGLIEAPQVFSLDSPQHRAESGGGAPYLPPSGGIDGGTP